MNLEAIIFDFDGVILESLDIKTQAFAHLFRDYPEKMNEIINYHMLHGGISRFTKFDYIYKNILHQPLFKQKKDALGKEFQDYVYQKMLECPFVRGASEFLNRYYRKIHLFIVSGTPEEEIKSIIKERKLEKFFVEVFGSPAKKEELNAKILEKHKISPGNVLFVGDSQDDYEAAKRSGIRFIGRVNKENYFSGLKIEAIIADLSDLKRIVSGLIGVSSCK